MGLHAGIVGAGKLLNICEVLIVVTAAYGLHLTTTCATPYEEWSNFEKYMIILAWGFFSESRKGRLSDIAKLLSLQETKGVSRNRMVERLKRRASAFDRDKKARLDYANLEIVKRKLVLQQRWTRKDITRRRKERIQRTGKKSARRKTTRGPTVRAHRRAASRTSSVSRVLLVPPHHGSPVH